MDAFSYFPATVYRDERPDLVEKVLPVCMRYLDQVRKPDIPICQSDSLVLEPDLIDVSNYLLLSSVDILRSQGYLVDKYDFYLSGLWAQETKQGSGTNIHVHKNSQICGWFFLESPEGGTYPIYHDTRMNKQMIELDYIQGEAVTAATQSIHFNNMKAGTVMFSNSWMQHQLGNGMSELPTRCIHFIVSHKERQCNIC
jgi:hypothetical protein